MKKLAKVCMLSTMVLTALTGCGQKNDDKIRVGYIGPLTGTTAVYGNAVKNAYELAVSEINENGGVLGKEIVVDYIDDQSKVQDAIKAYDKLLSNDTHFILGAVTSGSAKAVAEKSKQDGIPMLTPTGTDNDITVGKDNVFRTCFTDPMQGRIMADFAKEMGFKNIGIVYDSGDPYSTGVATAFEAKAKENAIKVSKEAYPSGTSDFSAIITKVKNNEAIFIPSYYEDDVKFVQQARSAGFTGKFLGADGWDGVIRQIKGEDGKGDPTPLNGSYFCAHYYAKDENVKAFVEKYTSTYKIAPDSFAALAYDSVYIMKEAIERANSLDYDKVVEAMKNTDYKGITGHIKFDENGDPIKSTTIIEVKDGEYTKFTK
ncbi:MAG: ABC transporter substrate-binding protein [Bacilli bacterium]|nr:ABC transporter substrate-binding protein [Bacilli bacterium]